MDRKSYQRKLDSRLLHAWAKMCVLYPELEKHNMPDIRIDARIKVALAYYYLDDNTIRVSWYWAQKDSAHVILREVVAHEVAHHVDHLLNGHESTKINDGHGPNWQKVMLEYGIPAKVRYAIG